MVDTHCHIFSEYYDNINDVIENAIESGIKMIVVNGYNMSSNIEVLELVKKYDIVYGALGIQPEEIDDYNNSNIKFIEDHINDEKIIAVGEIGLDFHYDVDRDKQIDLFRRQLLLAVKYNKPVIIHSRDCIQETYNILKEFHVKGIMHCYSGSLEMAHEFCKLGFYLGIGGISTFKNASKMISVIKGVPLEYLVLETDSPFLTPEPYRGSQNEPANVGLILKKICEIKKIDYQEASDVVLRNVLALFDKQFKL